MKPKQNQSREFKLTKHIYKRKAVPKKTDARISIFCGLYIAGIVTVNSINKEIDLAKERKFTEAENE